MKSLIGKVIDNYHILEIIGQGGMGIVYKAEDTALEKEVAIKVIDPFLARDENFLRRFKTEAKAMAKLQNPNIVTVHALRETEFGFFMVMELVDGKTVSEWIKQKGTFSLKDTINIAKQLLNAIGYAHRAGVIHRDIKPSNILLTAEGKIKVMDFGLAKVMQKGGPESTMTHMRAGTLHYMSPEQVKGLRNVDTRSDIYSLGMTIYEMLAGRTPFEKTATEFTIQKQIVDGKIPSPLKFNTDIPRPIVKIILKAIAKDPQKRYQNAEDMLADMNNAVSSPDQGKAATEIIVSTFNKKPLLYASAAGALVIIILFLIFIIPGNGNDDDGNDKKDILAKLTIASTPPGALVFINGDSIGFTPIPVKEFKAGSLNIQIQKEGYEFYDTSLILRNTDSLRLNITLAEESTQPGDNEIYYGGLQLDSEPSGADVWIDGNRAGKTPFTENNIKTGKHRITIQMDYYDNYNKTVVINKDRTTDITATLSPTGLLNISSVPSGAKVYLENELIGSTPITHKKVRVGQYSLRVQKEGYVNLDTSIFVIHKKTEDFSVALKSPLITLKILVRPYGSIYINNALKVENTNRQYETKLSYGSYTVRAVHPVLGEWEKQIDLGSNSENDILVDFNKEYDVIITSDPNFGEIYIDGQSTGKYTPKQIKLRTGKHKIEVRKEGYKISSGTKIINIEKNISDPPLHFALEKE